MPESMFSKKWFTLNGEPIEDIKKAVLDACWGDEKSVFIGTDSQQHRRLEFVTSIIVYTLNKGARVFYTKTYQDKAVSLRKKLVDEAWLSIYTAWEIEPVLPKNVDLASIHIDVNPDEKYDSSKYHREIYWLVKGQGFEVVSKPWGWAASHVSEHIVKHKPEGRKVAAH